MAWGSGRTSTTAHRQWARAVLRRDGYQCQQCGHQGARGTGEIQADHIIPVAEGGPEFDLGNGQALCRTCHAVKSRAEAARGSARRRRRREPEAHPGAIRRA